MHGLRIVTPPTAEPISLAEAKAHCRIYGSDDDGLIAGYIMAARSIVERAYNLALITQTWDMTLPCWPDPCGHFLLGLSPVQSVTSIKYYDTANVQQTLSATAYDFDGAQEPARVTLAFGYVWPMHYVRLAPIAIRFVAGYGSQPGSVPEPIRLALLLLVGHFYENREAVLVGQTAADLPFGVDALLSPYRVFY